MKIMDRYIIRQFLVNFVILTAVLMLLFILVDLIVDLDEFIKGGRVRAARIIGLNEVETKLGIGSMVLGLLWTFGDYYGPLVLLIYVFFSGLLVSAAMGFTFTALTRSRQILAMITSGVSAFRIATPVLIVGCMFNIMTLPIQEYLIPKFAAKLARPKSQIMYDQIKDVEINYVPDQSRRLFSASKFDSKLQTLFNVKIIQRSDAGRIEQYIRADSAHWIGDEERHGWELLNGYAFKHGQQPNGEVSGYNPEPIAFLPTDLSPQVLLARRAAIYPRLLSFGELNKLKSNMPQNSSIQQIIQSRMSLMVVNTLVMVMGLPFFLLRDPSQNVLVQVIKAAGICIGAWVVALLVQQLSSTSMNPVTASWLPVILYLPVTTWLLQTVKT